jgi:uncharacterized membrane protein YfhO
MLQSLKSFYVRNLNMRWMLTVGVLMLLTVASAAQTAVTIDIPVDDMITNLNTWIGVFAPILLFVGMIPVALGLLRYIIKLFVGAFGGASR